MERPIRVLIVDDSVFMRVTIQRMLESDPEIEVVGTANNGKEALEMVKSLEPDVVTLDIEMPVMDGLVALKIIMEENPLPVIMLSSLTEEGAVQTIQALELGAVDFIPKKIQEGNTKIMEIRETLVQRVKASAGARPMPKGSRQIRRPEQKIRRTGDRPAGQVRVVAIGASTGGPSALQDVISYLPEDFPAAVLVVQHMPKGFTRAFAKRLNDLSEISVKEAEDGDEVLPGRALIAPAGMHLLVRRGRNGEKVVHLSEKPSDLPHRPSVDVMMRSVAEVYRESVVGVVMTGMGQDGMEGMKAIKEFQGRTLAQDRESCVVYGMPKAVVDSGAADKVVPLSRLAEKIVGVVEG